MSSYFFLQARKTEANADFLDALKNYAETNKEQIYILSRPLTDQKYSYDYQDGLIVLSPKRKIAIIRNGGTEVDFNNYVDDVVEDIGSISDKYLYRELIGRPRDWRRNLHVDDLTQFGANLDSLFLRLNIDNEDDRKNVELLISLFIGSINDVDRVKSGVPHTILDKVKQKIQLFDGDQTRFIYQKPEKKRISIQGLSGTGKTELLLHKLKDLYVSENSSSIFFTCHNRILAASLRKRIPSFFNFMKVEQQIEWEKRFWCVNAWGSIKDVNSGAYRRICHAYSLPFYTYSADMGFSRACKIAVDQLSELYKGTDIPPAFTYMFIDESQDFDENFFRLCEMVTEKNVYIAGDIFQSIFDSTISSIIEPDFLLGKCYRTDPKTLMFAHGLGMGLFEDTKLRWLDEKEWKDCGYKVEVKDNKYILSREPLRRFEDLPENFESIRIVDPGDSVANTIIGLLQQVKADNPTVIPDDIGIIMLDQNKSIYPLADELEMKIKLTLDWDVNKAYETKQRRENTLLLSNRNNVKGLEFPFVICVTSSIKNSQSYRNSLYTMLTRSFIESYLVIPDSERSGLTPQMKSALEEIRDTSRMTIRLPDDGELESIKTNFEYMSNIRSHFDVMNYIFEQLGIDDEEAQTKFFALTRSLGLEEADEETLMQLVQENSKFILNK